MAKTWGELSQHPDFQSLSREEQEAVRGRYFDKYIAPQVAPEILGKARSMYDEKTLNRTWGDVATDLGVTALKGAVGLPEAFVGLADIPTGGRVGKALEEYGYRPGETQKILESWYSPTQKAANKRVEDAEGIVDTTVAAVKNPSVVANTILESLPLMGAGGLVGRGLVGAGKLAGRTVSTPLAAGAGEGLIGAGASAEAIRQQTPDGLLTPEQSALAAGSGALTGILGAAGGKLAQKTGLVDFETALAGATGPATRRGLAARVAGGAVSEGFLEELPQSVQEQALQNIALGKPWDEGLDQAAVLGTLSGGIMGAGMNAVRRPGAPATAGDPTGAPPAVDPAGQPPPDAGPTVEPTVQPSADPANFASLAPELQQQALQNVAAGKPWDEGLGITDAEVITPPVAPQNAPPVVPQATPQNLTPQPEPLGDFPPYPGPIPAPAPAPIPVVGPLSAAANAGQQASAAGISSTPAPTAEQQAAQQQAQVKQETAAAKDQAALQSAQLKVQQQQQEAAAKQAQQQQDAALKQQQAALKLKQEQLKINQSEQKLGMGPTQFDEPALLGQANDLAALSQPTIDQPTPENADGLQAQTDAKVPSQVPSQAPNAAANSPAGEVALATTQAPAAATGQTSAPGVQADETLLSLARQESEKSPFRFDIENDAQGVMPGKLRDLDKRVASGETTLDEIATGWQATRDELKRRHGDTVTLYRADAPESEWNPNTKTVYMADQEQAQKFAVNGREAQPFQVKVDDIVAVYARPSGYREFIVKLPEQQQAVAPLSNNPALAEDQAHVDLFNQANQRLNARKKEATPRVVVRLATEKDLPAAGRGARRLAGAIAAAFGHRVIYIASADEKAPLSFDGSVSPTDPTRIFIANDAEAPVTRVVAHEVLHGLKRVAPDVYDNMLGSLRRLYDPQKVARHAEQRGYQGGLNEANEEEWVADFFSNTLHDPKSLAQVALAMDLKKTGAGLEFLNNLKEFIGRVIAKLRGDQTLGQGFDGADEAVKDLEQARAAVVKAIAEYARARLTGKTAESLGDVPLAARLTPEEKAARAQKKTDDQAAAAKAKNPPLETGNEVTDIYNRRTVSARAPTSPGAKENPVTQDLGLDLNTYLKAPNLLAKVMATLSTYPQLRPARAGTTDEQQLRTFIGVLRDNLLWLHDQVDPKIRERSKLWYDGALKITERAAKRYQVTRRQFAAVLATQSPQKDWFENVSLADRITSIFQRYQNHAWDAKMEKAAARVLRQEELAELAEDLNEDASEASASSSKFINAKARAIATKSQGKVSFERAKEIATAAQAKKNEVNQARLDRVRGKRLDELYDDLDAAIWVRVFDAAHHSPHYHTVSPEGNFVGIRQAALGPARIRWGTFAGVAKSIAVLKDGTIENISTQLGKEHKIRNFYNNIIAPNDPRGYVTMDTHAIAADMVSPFSGFSIPVSHNFGSRGAPGSSVYGISGTYPIHGEGYTRAAKARDLLPREMQSITWEAIRGMFPAQFKRKPNIDHINALWQDYHDGKLTLAKTREAILEYVKTKTNRTDVEIFAPEWTRSPAAHLSDVSYEELPGMPAVSPANYRAGSGMNVEVAPNPDLLKGAAKGAAAKWGALTAEERRKVTEVVGRPIIKQVMAKLGITQYRPEFTVGGYETEANPSITLHFSPEVSWEQLEEATRVLGYLWKQKEMVMFDETDKTSDGQVTFIQVKPSRPLSAEEISDLYVSTNAAFPAAGGMSVSNGAPVFANFSDLTDEEFEKGLSDAVQKYLADKDYSAEAGVTKFRSALIGDVIGQDKKTGDDIVQTTLRGTRYDEETQTTGTGGKDGWRTNGKTTWSGGEDLRWKRDFDAIQTAFDQRFQREVGHAHRRVVKQRNAAPLSLRPNAAGDRRTGGGPAAQERPSYGTARPGAVKGTGVHYSRAERQTLDSTKYGTGLAGREAQRIAAAKDARLKQRVYFYINNGTGIHPEQGVGGYTHTVDLNNLYDLDADPQYLFQPIGSDEDNKNAFESAVLDAGFDGYVADFAGQRAAVLLGAHQVPVRFEGMAQRPAVPAGERATPNPLKRVAALLRAPWLRQTPQAFGAKLKAADPDLYRQFADQLTATDQTYWPGDMVSQLRDPDAPPRLVFSNRPTVREENLAKREYGAVIRKFTNSDGSRKPGWLKAPNGQPSNLAERQWVQVRTPSFKKWFGDWEAYAGQQGGVWNDGEGKVSKIVDENGEPRVVYHGSEKAGFTVLDPAAGDKHRSAMVFTAKTSNTAATYAGTKDEAEMAPAELPTPTTQAELEALGYEFVREEDDTHGIWWSVNDPDGTYIDDSDSDTLEGAVDRAIKDYAKYGADYRQPEETQPGVYSLFLNIRNPYESHFGGANWDGQRLDGDSFSIWDSENEEYVDYSDSEPLTGEAAREKYEELGGDDVEFEGRPRYDIQEAPELGETTNSVAEEALSMGMDGAIITNVVDDGGRGRRYYVADRDDVMVFFNANQAKSATQNTGEFSASNDDLRFSLRPSLTLTNPKVDYQKEANPAGSDADRERVKARLEEALAATGQTRPANFSVLRAEGPHFGVDLGKPGDDISTTKQGLNNELSRGRGGAALYGQYAYPLYESEAATLQRRNFRPFFADGGWWIDAVAALNGAYASHGSLKGVNPEAQTELRRIDRRTPDVWVFEHLPFPKTENDYPATRQTRKRNAKPAPAALPKTLLLDGVERPTTNTGTFDPDNADIRFSNRPNPEPPPAETRFRKAQRVVQDKFNRFKVVQDWLKTQGVQLSEAGDVYRAEERFHARVANQIEDFREQTLKPLVAKSQKAGFKMADIAQFLHAQHAEERNDAIAKINPKFPDGGSGMATAEARTILAAASPELKQIAAEWRQLADDSLELKLQAGLITQEQADAFRAKYAYYVPLRGGPEEQLMVGTGKGLKVRHKEQRALGHPVREGGEWIIEQLLADRESAIMKAEKALIAKHVLQMAVEMQRPDIISVEQPKQRQVLKNQVSYVVTYKGSPIEAFQSLEAARVFRQMAGTQKGNHIIDFDIVRSSDPQVVLMASPRLGDNELMAYVAGHEIRIQINDDLLSRAYGNLGQDALGPILRAGRVLNTWLSKVYTGYNPEFILVNLMRDFTTGIANLSGEQGAMMAMRAVKRYPKAFRDLLRYARNPARATQSIKDYREDGGNTGAAYLDDLERIGTDVAAEYAKLQGVIGNLRERNARGAASSAIGNTIKPLVSWIEKLNQAGENAMRLAIYQAMRDSGKGRVAAASAAKNTTVNFNRKGELGLALNAWWLFFNAAVQGTSSIAHAHFKGATKGQAWAFSAGLAGTAYLAALLAAGDDEEDDEYEKISEYDRSRNLIVRTQDGFVKLPLPYGYGFFANLGRGLADAQRTGELGKLPWHLASGFIEEFTPFGALVAGKQPDWQQAVTFMGPTAWQIGAVPAYNRTSFGTPLYPEQSFKTEEFARDQMWRGTKGTWADELAGALEAVGMDVSPETLKHLWRTGTGGAGTFVTGVADAVQLKARGAEDLDAREIPLLRKFRSVPGVQEARARYYEAVEEAKVAKETFARYKKQGRFEEMETYQGENEALISMAKVAEATAKRIKKARDLYDSVKLDPDLGVAEKRRQLREMEREETQIYDEYVRMFQERTRVAPR